MGTYNLSQQQLYGAGILNSFEIPVGGGSSFSNVYSVDFDGVDDVVSGSTEFNSLDGATQATWMLWFKTTADTIQYPISQWDASSADNRNLLLLIKPSDDRVDISVGSNTTYRRTDITISEDEWHHAVVTFNGGTANKKDRVIFYLDGIQYKQTTYNGPDSLKANPTSPLTVGGRTAYTFFRFNGNIDEVAIFDTELTSGEVSTYYNSGTPTDLTGEDDLIHWWRMGDGDTFPILQDSVGSYNMNMVNMASGDIEEDVPT
jgi:hypothetical protein